MSAIDRVKRLIALTASDNPNEARNAAQQACRIIREQGLEVVDPKAVPPPPPSPPPPRQRHDWPFGTPVGFGGSPFVDVSSGPFASEAFWRQATEKIRQNARRAAKEPEGEEWQCDACHATIRAHDPHHRHRGGKRVHAACPDGRVCTPMGPGWEFVVP